MNQIDRAIGAMNGIAVGNLLGVTIEGWSRDRILAAYPEGLPNIEARPGYPDDDDLAQSIIVAKAAHQGALQTEDLGRRLWDWSEINGLGIGVLTQHVLALYGGDDPRVPARDEPPEAARAPRGIPIEDAAKEAWAGYRAGNGALMRCAPIAILWRWDSGRLVHESIVSAVPTHWDNRCGWSCAIVNLAIAEALRGNTLSTDELIERAREGVAAYPGLRRYGYEPEPPASVIEALEQASSMASIDDLTLDGADMGYTLLAMQAALVAYWRAESFESGLRQVVEAGGDTDTNGAIVGAVLGARFGNEAIPPRWLTRVSEIRAGRTPMEEIGAELLRRGKAIQRLTS